jgi:hypothetical protein
MSNVGYAACEEIAARVIQRFHFLDAVSDAFCADGPTLAWHLKKPPPARDPVILFFGMLRR